MVYDFHMSSVFGRHLRSPSSERRLQPRIGDYRSEDELCATSQKRQPKTDEMDESIPNNSTTKALIHSYLKLT